MRPWRGARYQSHVSLETLHSHPKRNKLNRVLTSNFHIIADLSLNQNIACSSWPGETSAEKRALKSLDIWKSPSCLQGARFALGRLNRFRV